jgi:putative transposase
MPNYRGAFVPGGCWFSTVNPPDRRRRLVTGHTDALREAIRLKQTRQPFSIDAMLMLPDHIRAVWTLPPVMPIFVALAPDQGGFAKAAPQSEQRTGLKHGRASHHLPLQYPRPQAGREPTVSAASP